MVIGLISWQIGLNGACTSSFLSQSNSFDALDLLYVLKNRLAFSSNLGKLPGVTVST
jgi:hypothetical protein